VTVYSTASLMLLPWLPTPVNVVIDSALRT
jgi:hypothetical protein